MQELVFLVLMMLSVSVSEAFKTRGTARLRGSKSAADDLMCAKSGMGNCERDFNTKIDPEEKSMTTPAPKNKLPGHYGALVCVKVTDSDHLLMILDELGDEVLGKMDKEAPLGQDMSLPSGFYHNRASIVDAYKEERLFGLQVSENDAMFEDKNVRLNPLFMKRRSFSSIRRSISYSLPCFAVVDDKAGGKECSMLWVAERARGHGFGSNLMAECGVTHASDVLIESTGFWTKIGFELDSGGKRNGTYVRGGTPRKKSKHRHSAGKSAADDLMCAKSGMGSCERDFNSDYDGNECVCVACAAEESIENCSALPPNIMIVTVFY